MAFGVNSVLNMGVGALFASQASIQTTGNNISNVNTDGYTRRGVRLEEKSSLDYYPGQVGQGVDAKEVFRYFDRFVESAYLDKYTLQRRYEEEYSLLRTTENVFNESLSPGISSALTDFFKAWTTLSQEPESAYARAALLEKSHTFASSVKSAEDALRKLEEQMNAMIQSDVNRANTLIKQIADLNREINAHTVAGKNNANAMMDDRDAKVRELSGILDIHVDDKGGGHYSVTTGAGQLLVQEDVPYSLEFRGPRVENNLKAESTYKGTAAFEGADGYEYTVQITKSGSIDTSGVVPPASGTAEYRVSLDGGKTWILDDATGQPKTFYATDEAHSTQVKDLRVSFTDVGSNLTVGDKFLLTPKSDVYWISPTAGPIDISTQIFKDGTDNDQRITGGSLGGYLEFRDDKIGAYRDRLNAFARSAIWEVNRIHSQGAGLEPMTYALGTYRVERHDVPLGSPSSGFTWADKLQAGNVTFAIYDSVTGKPLDLGGAGTGLDVFYPSNFDPAAHTLEDVRDAINNGPAGAYLKADIVDDRLQIAGKIDPVTNKPYGFGITADTTGLAAGLGINTYFSGESSASIGVREDLTANNNLINAGRVNGGAEGNKGDNITARAIADLMSKQITVKVEGEAAYTVSLTDYYATLVTKVGADTASTKFTASSERTMATELNDRREEISGVNLDEEMSNLIRFQASYKAAAKLITTADEMIQTLLSLKQ